MIQCKDSAFHGINACSRENIIMEIMENREDREDKEEYYMGTRMAIAIEQIPYSAGEAEQ